jgi:FHA domain
VDGRVVAPETGLTECGLCHGSRITLAGGAFHARKAVAFLRGVGGLEAGRSVPLTEGRTAVGRGAEADARVTATGVSRLHAAFEVASDGQVTVADLGSSNGTDVNGVRITKPLRVGADDVVSLGGEVALRAVGPDRLGQVQRVNVVREAGPGGTLPFNRVPRVGSSADQAPIAVPAPLHRAEKPPCSVSSMLGPLVMAGAIVALTGDARYAAIAALTPMMFVANFLEERLRGKSRFRRGMREQTEKVERFERALAARHAVEVRTRRAAHPDPAEVVHLATAPGLRLWERRRDAADFLQVVAGTADLPWAPPLEMPAEGPSPEAATVLAEWAGGPWRWRPRSPSPRPSPWRRSSCPGPGPRTPRSRPPPTVPRPRRPRTPPTGPRSTPPTPASTAPRGPPRTRPSPCTRTPRRPVTAGAAKVAGTAGPSPVPRPRRTVRPPSPSPRRPSRPRGSPAPTTPAPPSPSTATPAAASSEVQCIPRARGYNIGPAGVDGVFGDDTLTSVKGSSAATA